MTQWKVHTPRLLNEIAKNPECCTLVKPLQIFGSIMHEVGVAAAKVNDPALNALMCRLTIYSIADPDMPDYDSAKVSKIIEDAP